MYIYVFDEIMNGGSSYIGPPTAAVARLGEDLTYAYIKSLKSRVFNCRDMDFDPVPFKPAEQVIPFEGPSWDCYAILPLKRVQKIS